MLNKIIKTSLLILICFNLSAQQYKNGIGIYLDAIDIYGPQTGHYLTDKKAFVFSKRFFWDPGVQVSYHKKISTNFEMSVSLHYSSLYYPEKSQDSNYYQLKQGRIINGSKTSFWLFNTGVDFNFWSKEHFIFTPFLYGGIGVSWISTFNTYNAPLGFGVHCKLSKGSYINLKSTYNLALEHTSQDYLLHSIGIATWFRTKSKQKEQATIIDEPLSMITILDRDNDGVLDQDDYCPDLPGRKEAHGCPDSDGDGFLDYEDKCPLEAGIARYQGCPIPDRDNDGFNDEIDECPDESFEDNNGCPYIKKEEKEKVDLAAKGIYYQYNSAEIDSSSFGNLNEIVMLLILRPDLNIEIEGHTDNKGSKQSNLLLSQLRADACKKYLTEKGIHENRITSTGIGDSKPIEDNSTEEGRSKNRRTEFILIVEN